MRPIFWNLYFANNPMSPRDRRPPGASTTCPTSSDTVPAGTARSWRHRSRVSSLLPRMTMAD